MIIPNLSIFQPCPRTVGEVRAEPRDFLPTKKAYSLFRLVMEQTDNWYYSELDAIRVVGVVWKRQVTDEQQQQALKGNESEASEHGQNSPCYLDRLSEEVLAIITNMLSLKDFSSLAKTSSRYKNFASRSM